VLRRSAAASELVFAGAPAIGAAFADVTLSYRADPGRPSLSGGLGRGYVRVTDRSSGVLMELARRKAHRQAPHDMIDGHPGVRYGLPSGTRAVAIPVSQEGGGASSLVVESVGGRDASLTVTGCRAGRWWADPLSRPEAAAGIVRLARPVAM